MNNLYPIFLKMSRRQALVVGGGEVAEQKIKGLLAADAEITVIAPDATGLIEKLAAEKKLTLHRRKYRLGDLDGMSLAVGATDDRNVQLMIYDEAKAKGIPVNIVDVPDLCTFYLGSIFRDGDLSIAVSTNGKSPTLGKVIRDKIAAEFTDGYPEILDRIGSAREIMRQTFEDYDSRKRAHREIVGRELQQMDGRTEHGYRNTATASARSILRNGSGSGKVFLVGAGPGDPELISVKGLHTLRTADVVVYDALVSEELLTEAPKAAEMIYVGKRAGVHSTKQAEINELLLEKVCDNKVVVRLKGGDPFIFGRGGEEVEFLRQAGVDVEIIPGITSGIGVPTSLGIPLTYRGTSCSVAFVTGHEDPEKFLCEVRWENVSKADTIVVYMGIKKIAQIAEELVHNGVSPTKPAAVIFGGTLSGEIVVIDTVENISHRVSNFDDEQPGLIVIGDVVNLYRGSKLKGMTERHKYAVSETLE